MEEAIFKHPELDHGFIFVNYVNSTKDLLVGAFGIDPSDALTLSLNGIRDLWGYQGFEALSISKYGVNNSQVDAAFEKYTKGTGGTKCN